MAPRIGIIGGGRVGRIHARHYRDLGADVVAVLSSSLRSAQFSILSLSNDLNIKALPYGDLNSFLDEKLDGVSICTPPSLHLSQMLSCFNKNIAVFCEKPLFQCLGVSEKSVAKQLSIIETHPHRRLFVNTSNTIFLDAIIKNEFKRETYKSFDFEFHTVGKYTELDIAQDLLPHGLSLLIHLLGNSSISNFVSSVSKHRYDCQFRYGECFVSFNFQENPNGNKHMRIGLNGNFYTRIQVGDASTYVVYLENDKNKKKIRVEDPFRSYINTFLNYISSKGTSVGDEFPLAALNMHLMYECLRHE